MRNSMLCVSFSRLVFRLVFGKIEPADLVDALFYFGCAREDLFGADGRLKAADLVFVEQPSFREINHPADRQRFVDAIGAAQERVMIAERGGRVAWRTLQGDNTYEQLNKLLERAGFAPLPIDGFDDHGAYTYRGVDDRVRAAGLPLEVHGS